MNLVWEEVFFLMSFAFLTELISAAQSACSFFHLCLSFYLSILPSPSSVRLHPVFYPASPLVLPHLQPPRLSINMYALGWGAHYGEMGAGVCMWAYVSVSASVCREASWGQSQWW